MKVGVIGAGVFGLTAALELGKFCNVTVFERHEDLLAETTTNNMLRHHMGYHYPRSDATVEIIKKATPSFEEEFGECIVKDFPAYYSVAKENSWSTAEEVLQFCKKHDLPYEIIDPPDWLIDKNKITLCIKTPEPVYDPEIMKEIFKRRIAPLKNIKVLLGHEVVDGNIEGNKKILKINNKEGEYEDAFDIVVNATYSHFNTFNKWFGFPTPIVQYDLMEILEIELRIKERFGMLVLDGLFATILPKGKKNTFTLGHVKHTMLRRSVAEQMEEIHKTRNMPSNREIILEESAKLMPFLKNAKVINSLYSTRVIKANQEDDARPTEITEHGNGLYSIFAGKVITAVMTARELAEKVKAL